MKKGTREFTNFLFVLPALIIFSVFYIYPFFKVFNLSMHSWNGIDPTMKFVGFAHFKEVIFDDKAWWSSMAQAGYITLWALTFQNFLALLLALACDRAIRAGSVYRVIFFLPPILSEIVVGLVWKWIYNGDFGLLNHWLSMVGLGYLARDWLSDSSTALTAIALVHCWKGFGWAFIILLAGLQTIPRQLYEAATVDGADALKRFTNVTVPMMIPVFVLVVILTILGTMQGFALILAMTRGGPAGHTEVPVIRILFSMIKYRRFGYACCQALIFGFILVCISFMLNRVSKFFKQA
ncbi:MAG: sugar ABC transporter permease [Candidatus Omnitrophica bacterium]|nr:sugar ABC transporter permease [Candidatus Omnitrophota bacterium]